MSEYIVNVPDEEAECFIARFGFENVKLLGYSLTGEIVRCRDCKYYYEVDEYHPQGNYDRQCCKYFDTYDDEVDPDGFCAWSERMVMGQ